jgi:hypothetical protein
MQNSFICSDFEQKDHLYPPAYSLHLGSLWGEICLFQKQSLCQKCFRIPLLQIRIWGMVPPQYLMEIFCHPSMRTLSQIWEVYWGAHYVNYGVPSRTLTLEW